MSFAPQARRLASVFASNASGTVLGQAVQLVTIPLQLRFLGAEQFGLLVLFNSFVMAGSMADAGIGPTTLRYVARKCHSRRSVEHVVASGLTVLCAMFLGLSVLALLGAAAYAHWALPPETANAMGPVVYVGFVLLALGASMLCGLGHNILKGLQQYKRFAVLESIHRMGLPLVTTATAVCTGQVTWVLVSSCVWMLMSACLTLRVVIVRAGIAIRLTRHLHYFRKRMLSFSSWTWVQAVFGYLGTQADRLIIASVMSLSTLAAYAVAMSVTNAALAVMSAGASFLIPESASRVNDMDWLRRSFTRFTFLLSAVSALSIVAILPFAELLLSAWLGAGSATLVFPILVPLLWTFSNAATSIPGNYMATAMGHSKAVALMGAAGNSIVLISMIAGGMTFGLYGVLGGKLSSILVGFCIRCELARRVFLIPNAAAAATRMVWPTLLGCFLVLPLSWYYLVP
ncbi:MAG: oligosaccharide flippase family protein [Pseudomonadota bacterium]|nr:oligosaccharide flippase family protein [Pseudomonadota bacterium]